MGISKTKNKADMNKKYFLHSITLTVFTLLVLAFTIAQTSADFPAGFTGLWKRDNYNNTLTVNSNSVNASNQDNAWEIQSVSRDTYKIKSANTTKTITIKLNKDNLVISGDKGSGENNWNGTWKKQHTAAAQFITTAVKYWNGDGRKDIRLAVLEPTSKGLSASENWIPSMIQSSITGDFQRFSAMTIADRQNYEKVLSEQK